MDNVSFFKTVFSFMCLLTLSEAFLLLKSLPAKSVAVGPNTNALRFFCFVCVSQSHIRAHRGLLLMLLSGWNVCNLCVCGVGSLIYLVQARGFTDVLKRPDFELYMLLTSMWHVKQESVDMCDLLNNCLLNIINYAYPKMQKGLRARFKVNVRING